MVGYNINYFKGMDKYLSPYEENRFIEGGSTKGSAGGPKLSKPITSIRKLGTTIKGQNTNFGGTNILGALTAQIRGGSSTVQLAGFTLADASLTGKSKRQAIKEVLKASNVTWEGLEFASEQLTGVSGFDLQQNTFSEQNRQNQVSHVRDAIKFAADIGAGGGVDVWSREFSRSITGNFDGFTDFDGAKEEVDQMFTLVDKRTGRAIHQFQTGQLGGQGMVEISVPKWTRADDNYTDANGKLVQKGDYIDAGGNKLVVDRNNKDFIMNRAPVWDKKTQSFESVQMNWKDFKKHAKKLNDEFKMNLSAAEWVGRLQIEQQYSQSRAGAIFYQSQYKDQKAFYEQLIEIKKNKDWLKSDANKIGKTLEKVSLVNRQMKIIERDESLDDAAKKNKMNNLYRENISVFQEQERLTKEFAKNKAYENYDLEMNPENLQEIYKNNMEQIKNLKKLDGIRTSLQHSQETSARADAQSELIWETLNNIQTQDDYGRDKTFKSYAELGIEALKTTNQHKDLSAPIYVGPELGFPQGYGGHTDEFIEIIKKSRKKMVEQMKQDPHLRNQYTDADMKKKANEHIRGVMDTTHLSMWFNHFPKKNEQESEDSRLKRFNKWYLKQMEKLGKADVIGSIQVVDSATGDHAHLPIGEGIFPTIEGVKLLQKNGFDGIIVSEGHMYEDVDPGSTQFSLWNEFGASVGARSGYFATPGVGNSFHNVFSGSGMAGYGAPVNYIVGSYNPSNDWQLWSGTPLE